MKTKIVISIVILLGFIFYFRNEIKIGVVETMDSYKSLFEKKEVVVVPIKNEIPIDPKKEASPLLTPEKETVAVTKIQSPEEEELDVIGNILLEVVYKKNRTVPQYEGESLLLVAIWASDMPRKVFWPTYEQSITNERYSDVRKNVKSLLDNKGCQKDYVKNYLLELGKNPENFERESFKKDLACAGEISYRLPPQRE